MIVKLEVKKREQSAAVVREGGRIPAVVYGPKQEPVSITLDGLTFEKTLHTAGESTILTLVGLDEEIEALIQDVAFNAAKGGVDHVDFYAIERGKELTTDVAIEFIGEAPVTKSGASVTKAVHELEVTCRPSDLPAHIAVDISVLVDEASQIKLSDISVPNGVTFTADLETVIATVSAAREEEPEETPEESSEAADISSIEVEKKGKAEEESEKE